MNAVNKDSEKAPAAQRLTSLDAYRGLVMFLMLAEALAFAAVARACPESGFWRFLAGQQTHAAWIGCSLHDLIQPSFSFLVGVVMPFSLASRAARGLSFARMAGHALWRSGALIMLGVLLRSIGQSRLNWTFEDTLTQIGLGYFFLFLLGFRSARWQWAAAGLIVAGYWAAFALYPLPPPGFDYTSVGVRPGWPHLMTGFAAHWNKNSNLGWAFDTWFMNLFPRASQFLFNRGGYVTLSFIPTLGTMILGLIAGGILRDSRPAYDKVKWLLAAGALGLLAGLALGRLGICPVVKRIWTPSWVLFSGGWCFVLLAAFYTVVDVWHCKRWAFPLVVIGANSIAAYCLSNVLDFIPEALGNAGGRNLFAVFGKPYATLVEGGLGLLLLWLLLFWMRRRKLFLRI
jgi:predicted acyltransferase